MNNLPINNVEIVFEIFLCWLTELEVSPEISALLFSNNSKSAGPGVPCFEFQQYQPALVVP